MREARIEEGVVLFDNRWLMGDTGRSAARHAEATGTTPSNWLTLARVDRARELLEGSALSIDQIAARTGFGTATTLRHHFRRKAAISPSAYRNQFSRAKDGAGARQRADARKV